MRSDLIDYRCICGKLLFKASEISGALDIKCRGCSQVFRLRKPSAGHLLAPDWTVFVTEEGRFAGATESFEDILGYSRESLVGSSFFSLFFHPDSTHLLDSFNEIVRSDRSARCPSWRMRSANGLVYWVITTFIPYRFTPQTNSFFVTGRFSSIPNTFSFSQHGAQA